MVKVRLWRALSGQGTRFAVPAEEISIRLSSAKLQKPQRAIARELREHGFALLHGPARGGVARGPGARVVG